MAGVPPSFGIPQVETNDGHFGVKENQFGFIVTATNSFTVVIEAATNLANPIWSRMETSTNTTASGSFYFRDPQWVNYPNRFYRLRMP